jgi:hypothetical protein
MTQVCFRAHRLRYGQGTQSQADGYSSSVAERGG